MAVTRTLVDTDRVQIIQNKWLDDVRQYQQDWDTLHKHGTINALLANVGIGTNTTITVSENTAVNANTDLTSYPNIKWHFVGSGKLTPAAGITLTLYSPNTITCDPSKQCLDATNGTIVFAQPGTVYAGWFGARPAVQSVSFVQKAHDSLPSTGGEVVMTGNYLFNDTLDWSKDHSTLRGLGREITVITCTTVGVPAISVAAEIGHLRFSDFKLVGNNLTGGTGCGHGIALLDPTPDTGAYSPQQSTLLNLSIYGFRGSDSDGRGGSMTACGIAQVSTLENEIRNCRIDTCGIGLHLDSTYTPRIYDNIIIDNDKYGVQSLGSENLFMHGNDILNNGDSSTVNQTGYTGAPTGNAYIHNASGWDISGNKFKTAELANVVIAFSKGGAFHGNWIRANEQYGVILRVVNGASIAGNHFDAATGGLNNPRYLTIQCVGGKDSSGIDIRGNIFRLQGGITTHHCIKIEGDASARRFQASAIECNYFGDVDISSSATLTNAINVEQVTLQGVSISRNVFYAETNMTISCCFRTDANTSFVDFNFNGNQFHANGGTISNQKVIASGTFAQIFQGTGTPEGNVVAFIGSIYQRLDGGAGTTLYVKEANTTAIGWSDTA